MIPDFGNFNDYIGKGIAIMDNLCAKKMKIVSLNVEFQKGISKIVKITLVDENNNHRDVFPENCYRNRRQAIIAHKRDLLKMKEAKYAYLQSKKREAEKDILKWSEEIECLKNEIDKECIPLILEEMKKEIDSK